MNFKNNEELKFYNIQPGRLPIFLISGLAGAGKTTLARLMCNSLMPVITSPNRFYQSILSFANPIKRCAYEVFGWDGKKDERGRRLLQSIGTETGRNYNKDIWVDKLINIILEENAHLTHNAVFIDDWRFINEYEGLKKISMFYVVSIRVFRPEISKDLHLSENELNEDHIYDYKVLNVGTLNDLKDMGKTILQNYYGGL